MSKFKSCGCLKLGNIGGNEHGDVQCRMHLMLFLHIILQHKNKLEIPFSFIRLKMKTNRNTV